MGDMKIYLEPTRFIDCTDARIQKTALELTGELADAGQKAGALFNYVRDDCRYNMYAFSADPGDYIASVILERGEGYCVQKAILLAALGRAAGIPGRLALAALRNHRTPPEVVEMMGTNIFFPHIYNQFFLDGKWVSVAAPFDRWLCQRMEVPVVDFDGSNDAMLPACGLDGLPFVEYVKQHGHYADLPAQVIVDNMPGYYGEFYQRWISGEAAFTMPEERRK